MSRLIITFLLTALVQVSITAQCPTSVFISSGGGQSTLDDFIEDYPNCTSLENITIEGPTATSITSLQPLINIDTLYGDLTIMNISLSSLSGLENIKYIGGNVTLMNIDKLSNTDGIENLNFIGGDLIINNNEDLTTISGFDLLESIGMNFEIVSNEVVGQVTGFSKLKDVGKDVSFKWNDFLQVKGAFVNLNAVGGKVILSTIDEEFQFDNLQTVGSDLEITSCQSLISINAFDKLQSIGGNLDIIANPKLQSELGFNSLTTVMGKIELAGNNLSLLSGFNSLTEIGNSLLIREPLENFAAFESLTNIKGSFRIYDAMICPDPMLLTSIGQDLEISNLELLTLSNFNSLTNIGGKLNIRDLSSSLDSLMGFNRLVTLGSFAFDDFEGIVHFDAFESLLVLNNDLEIKEYNSLESFAGFSSLTTIKGDLNISNNQLLSKITNFVSLESVAGNFRINTNASLDAVSSFDQLRSVGKNFEIVSNASLKTITSFDLLGNLSTELRIDNNLELDTIAGFNAMTKVTFYSSQFGNSRFSTFKHLSGFNSIDTISSSWNATGFRLQTIDGFENLKHIEGYFGIGGENIIRIPRFDNLSTIAGDFEIKGNEKLSIIEGFTSLKSVSKMIIGINNTLAIIGGFNSLTSLSSLEIYSNPILLSIPEFDACTNIKFLKISNNESLGKMEVFSEVPEIIEIEIKNNPNLLSFEGFEALTALTTLTIESNERLFSIPDFENLQLAKTISIKSNTLLDEISGFKAVNDVLDLEIFRNQNLRTIDGFTNIEVFDNLEIVYNDSLESVFKFTNVREVINNFIVGQNNALEEIIGMEDCTRIGGSLSIGGLDLTEIPLFSSLISVGSGCAIAGFQKLNSYDGFANLQTVGGNLIIGSPSSLTKIPSFNSLDSIGGDLSINAVSSLKQVEGFNQLKYLGKSWKVSANDSIESILGFTKLEEIGQHFTLTGNALLDTISHFDNLATIRFDIYIWSNDTITHVPDFPALQTVCEITIGRNNNLRTIDGFNKLISISKFCTSSGLTIDFNPNLKSINGFNSLEEIRSDLDFNNNDVLERIVGFNALENLQKDFILTYNPLLTTINAFNNLRQINGRVSFNANPSLAICNFPFLCNHLENGGNSFLLNNGSSCNSADAVLALCDLISPIEIFTYFDINQNTIQDSGEPALANIVYDYLPFGTKLHSSLTNPTRLVVGDGTYQFDYGMENTLWQLMTDSTSYTVDVVTGMPTESIYFGLKPAQEISEMEAIINSPSNRCNTLISFDIRALNTGTTFTNGTLWFEFDGSISEYEFVSPPDVTDGTNRIGWTFTNLHPTGVIEKEIKLFIPGPDALSPGSYLDHKAYVEFESNNYAASSADFNYSTLVLCSFDPNDKMVNPSREGNFNLPDESLVYTIRFQNTGNAEAIDVTIIDTLSANLDHSTFRVLSASHEKVLTTEQIDGNIIHFNFKSIYLIDSLANEPASHGYVSFAIAQTPGLDEFDEIRNEAAIYFDFNPPIYTNETINIIAYDEDKDGFFSIVDCDDSNPAINSAALEKPYNSIDDDCDPVTLDDDLDQDGFLLEDDCDDTNRAINPDAVEIPNNGIDEDCDGMDLVSSTHEVANAIISIYPNPTTELINIIVEGRLNFQSTLYDLQGKLILRSTNSKQLKVDSLKPGIYLLEIKDLGTEQKIVERVMIEH